MITLIDDRAGIGESSHNRIILTEEQLHTSKTVHYLDIVLNNVET